MSEELQIPFDEKGNMLTYETWYHHAQFRPATSFKAKLKIVRVERGRSACHFILEDKQGHEYTMFYQYIMPVLEKGLEPGGYITGKWGFIKRGANYGIVLEE